MENWGVSKYTVWKNCWIVPDPSTIATGPLVITHAVTCECTWEGGNQAEGVVKGRDNYPPAGCGLDNIGRCQKPEPDVTKRNQTPYQLKKSWEDNTS